MDGTVQALARGEDHHGEGSRWLLAAEGVREPACLQRRNPRSIQDPDDLIDKIALPGRKLVGLLLSLKTRIHSSMDGRGIERSEFLDDSAKLASPQEECVVLEVVDGHGEHAVPIRPCKKRAGTSGGDRALRRTTGISLRVRPRGHAMEAKWRRERGASRRGSASARQEATPPRRLAVVELGASAR